MPDWITTNQATKLRADELRQQMYPLSSITAAATRLTTKRERGRSRTSMPDRHSWQAENWDMFDLVGELHFLTTTLSNRVGSGALYVGEVAPGDPTAEPTQTENETVQAVLAAFGGTQAGQSQILRRMGLSLIVAGEGWLFGVDADRLDAALESQDAGLNISTLPVTLPGDAGAPSDPTLLEWRALSVDEVEARPDGTIHIQLEDGTKIAAKADSIDLIRVWRPHGRKAAEPDSPVKASLPVLRELVGYTMRAAAEIDSRLAGAGILWVRQSVLQALRTGEETDSLGTADDLMRELIKTMMTPIQDRESAAAVVPMILPIPDDVVDPLGHVTFATPLDAELQELREGAIRRFALGMDAPPEILMGTAAANHWGAWLVNEDTVTVHIEPPLAMICDALTTQYLWPALIASGMSEEEAQKFVVWYSVEHMVVRPNQFEEAKYLYENNEIDGATVRRAGGFDDSDAQGAGENQPETGKMSEEQAGEIAIEMAFGMVNRNPALASSPGLPKLARDIASLLTGEGLEEPEPLDLTPAAPEAEGEEEGEDSPAGVLPTEPTTDGPPQRMAASAADSVRLGP